MATTSQRLPAWLSKDLWIALGLGAAALVLRLWRLDKDCLWGDEYGSWLNATAPTLAALLRQVTQIDNIPPTYYLLLRATVGRLGDSDFNLRLPSALAGAATVPVFYGFIRALLPERRATAILGGALMAIWPMQILYSQEARAYGLELFFLTAALAALAAGLRRSSGLFLICAALLADAALLTHYYAALAWLTVAAVLLWQAAERRFPSPRTLAAPLAILALGMIAAALIFSRGVAGAKSLAWLPARYGPELLFHVARAQLLGALFSPLPAWAQWAGLAAGVGLAGAGLQDFMKHRHADRLPITCTVAGLTLMLIAPVAGSFVSALDYYGQRYLIIALPWTVLLVSAGATGRRSWHKRLAIGALVILLACQGAYLWAYYGHRQKRQWDKAAQWIDQQAAPNIKIGVIPAYSSGLIERYLPQPRPVTGLEKIEDVPLALSAAPGGLYLVTLKDPRPWLARMGLGQAQLKALMETHRPGQDLWITEIKPGPEVQGGG